MSDIPALTGKKIIKALEKAGFVVIRIKRSHHFLSHPDSRKTVVPIHSGETIGKGLFAQILKDCDLTLDEFLKLLKL
jgi:predicted RNA binding protein YcfA (HicA-like mRNA interferase family)